MPIPALILFFTVLVLDLCWVTGVKLAASRAFPGAPARQMRWTMPARLIFVGLVVIEAAFGSSGILGRFDTMPPPFLLFMLLCLSVSAAVAFTGFGELLSRHLSFSALIGFQAFRILAELVIYLAHQQGLAPRALTFQGYNFDIITGLTALPLAWHLRSGRRSPGLIRAWNWMGIAFLAVILFIGITSMPVPFRVFMEEPSNVWVTTFPYVLLPGILVVAAFTGHLLALRKLALEGKREGKTFSAGST